MYGNVTDCIIMRDKETGKSRGFGFVTFDGEEAVEKVLQNAKEHVLMDKWIDCKRATAKPAPMRPSADSYPAYGNPSYPSSYPMQVYRELSS